jgi:hypothetical protein
VSTPLFPDGLDDDFAANTRRLMAAVREAGGSLRIRSGYRTRAQQEAIYRRKMADGSGSSKTVGRPGHSQHERGLAVDFAGSGKSLALAAKLAPQFGIVQAPWTGGPQRDPVHFEPVWARSGRRPAPPTGQALPPPSAPVVAAAPPPWPEHFFPQGPVQWEGPAAPPPRDPRFYLTGGPSDPSSAMFAALMRQQRNPPDAV